MKTRPLTPRQIEVLYSALTHHEVALEDAELSAENDDDPRALRRVHTEMRVLESIMPSRLRRVIDP